MHKYLYLLTATYFLTLNSSLSQNLTSIAPNTINSAYCPNTNISFTVTIANTGSSGKYYSSPQAISYPIPTVTGCIGAVITSSATMTSDGTNTYIKFTGHFTDANQPQGIEVSYYDNNNMFWKSDYHYDEIQSFAIPDVSKSEPKPSPSSIKATRCQSQTFNVSFLNVSYTDDFPTPKLVYGTVTSYQYLLPSGWKLNGGAPSDGTTWLSANNNVNIASDLTHGDGQTIQIRGVNSCGSSIYGPVANISITRPAPALSITSSDGSFALCSGSKTFTVNGASPGSTYSWSISPASIATIPANSTTSSVVVTKAGTTSGTVTLTATATDCVGPLSVPQNILVGGPQTEVTSSVTNITNCQNGNFVILPSAPGSVTTYNGTVTVADPAGVATNYTWKLTGTTNQSGITFLDNGGGLVSVLSKVSKPGILALTCVATSGCGAYSGYYYFATTNCNAVVQGTNPSSLQGTSTEETNDNSLSTGQYINIYPNPARSMVTVFIPENVEIKNAFIQISDTYGRKIKTITSPNHSNNVMIQDLASGTYFIEIYNNQKLVTVKKLVKN